MVSRGLVYSLSTPVPHIQTLIQIGLLPEQLFMDLPERALFTPFTIGLHLMI